VEGEMSSDTVDAILILAAALVYGTAFLRRVWSR
jgi:hypothetical protein